MSIRARVAASVRRPHLLIVALAALLVPRRLRGEWRREWEAELRHRESSLNEWGRPRPQQRRDLLRRSTSALVDALWLLPRRTEDEMLHDVRFGVRMLRKYPATTAIAVATLALGIGANTAIFTLLDRVLVRQLPVESPDRLVTLVENADRDPAILSYPDFAVLRERSDVFAGVTAYTQRPLSLSDGPVSERVVGQIVSANYFSLLGVHPQVGRLFDDAEDRQPGASPVAVISDRLWRSRFAADPSVLGRSIRVNASAFTIVGVTPPAFTGTSRGAIVDLYVPITMHEQALRGTRGALTNRNFGWLTVIARLAPGVTRAQAQSALAIPSADDDQGGPKPKSGAKGRMFLADGSRGHVDRVRELTLPLQLLTGAVAFVLLIACANVANLLLARAMSRRREIAVRLANGATRARIARQLLVEGVMLALIGGAGGVLVGRWSIGLLIGFQQQTTFVPRTFDSSLDLRALAFTVGLSLVTGIAFALVPIRHAFRADVVGSLKDETPLLGRFRRLTFRNLLVTGQVALSVIMLVGAGLCVKSLQALNTIDPGFEPDRVVTASFDLDMSGYDSNRGREFAAALTRRMATVPGVESVSLANIVAFSDLFWISGASIDGYTPPPGERMAFNFNAVGPDYFRTIGAPLVSGREFTARDTREAPPVIIVNEAAQRKYWPDRDPVGSRTSRGEVIGVVRDGKERGLKNASRPTIYLALPQAFQAQLTLHVRTTARGHGMRAAIRRELQALDPALPIYNVQTLADEQAGSLYVERISATLLSLLAGLAVSLAAIGLYGTLSFLVTQRARELGIRLTLGARPADLLKLVVGQGLALTFAGALVGLGGAVVLTGYLRNLLFGVTPTDPLTFAATPVCFLGIALLACLIPARRAMRLDPVRVLRGD